MKDQTNKVGRFLSLILRHKPEEVGIELDEAGWTSIVQLIAALKPRFSTVDREMIERIVEENNKKRFAVSSDGKSIRANQGHSLKVDLNFVAKAAPEVLYHGTASRFTESIFKEGLNARSRNHVHLSFDIETASAVGRRHGKLVLLEIAARRMEENGFSFFQSENGVWLCEHVPPEYLTQILE